MEEDSGRKGLSQKRGYGTDQMVNIHSKSFSKFSVSLKTYYFDIKVHKWFSFEAVLFFGKDICMGSKNMKGGWSLRFSLSVHSLLMVKFQTFYKNVSLLWLQNHFWQH